MTYYSQGYLEKLADEINKKYYPERLEKVKALDIYDLMEKLGLEVEWKYISPGMQLLGMMFFEDRCWYVWDDEDYNVSSEPHLELFKERTVVINKNLVDNKKYKEKELFVATHECSHWIKDQDYFKSHTTNVVHACGEERLKGTYWNSYMSEEAILERQTNYLAAAILMPRDIIKKEFFKRLRVKNIPDVAIRCENYMKPVIKQLSKDFGLNYGPVLYRLQDLKILKK
ncbi:MAG: hypothetical protein IJS58_02660 [Bacilli bacterium]|nr:hypothetical protein [Bacilli bacterium]